MAFLVWLLAPAPKAHESGLPSLLALFLVSVTKVLFICLGNICRSPMAASILIHKVKQRSLQDEVTVDSAGTGSWHAGEPADPRTRRELRRHGLADPSLARQVTASDLATFDHILVMDRANLRDILALGPPDTGRVSLLLSWNPTAPVQEVPDPYYGGPEGFADIYNLIDKATEEFLNRVFPESEAT